MKYKLTIERPVDCGMFVVIIFVSYRNRGGILKFTSLCCDTAGYWCGGCCSLPLLLLRWCFAIIIVKYVAWNGPMKKKKQSKEKKNTMKKHNNNNNNNNNYGKTTITQNKSNEQINAVFSVCVSTIPFWFRTKWVERKKTQHLSTVCWWVVTCFCVCVSVVDVFCWNHIIVGCRHAWFEHVYSAVTHSGRCWLSRA